MSHINIDTYDSILDSMDNEDTQTTLELFKEYNLEPLSNLFDSPRFDHSDNELYTYLDYALSYELTDIIELFIDEMDLVIDDKHLSRSIELQNLSSYKFLCNLGYVPQGETLRSAVRMSCCSIVENILNDDKDLIIFIDVNDINAIFSSIIEENITFFNNKNDIEKGLIDYFNIDEDTVETIRVLLNYGIDKKLFKNILSLIQKFTVNNLFCETEYDIAIEIIDLLS